MARVRFRGAFALAVMILSSAAGCGTVLGITDVPPGANGETDEGGSSSGSGGTASGSGSGGTSSSGSSSGSGGSSSSSSSGGTTDAASDAAPESAPEASPSDATVTADAPEHANDTGADVAALDGGLPEGSCNTLTLSGTPMVNLVASTTAPPAQTGGTITDGTYYLTAATVYGEPVSGTSGIPMQGIWVISGGVTQLEGVFPSVISVPATGIYASLGITAATGLPGSASETDELVPPASSATSISHTTTCSAGTEVNPPTAGTWPYSVPGGGQTLTVVLGHGNGSLMATFTMQ
jgi:hypothetical protein